ncbi:MAG: hypothetical protein AB3N63_18595 [Puniceicoccaceae bacterium]
MKKTKAAGVLPWIFALGILGIPAAFTSCVQVKTEPIRIEPIYIEITVNHRVQKELDDLFGDIDRASETADFEPLEDTE